MVLKPTEKTPLSALLLADMLYEAGLPPEMLSVVTGDPREIADEMLTNADVDLVTFTGGVAVGKYIAAKAVYKRQVLELGGNDPIIVMEDADLDEAATLAAAGSYKNSGQRCTAVKRMLVHERVADAFVERLRGEDQARGRTAIRRIRRIDMGTVIDEAAAHQFETARQRRRRAGRQAARRQRAARRAVFADGARPRAIPTMNVVKHRDLRPGVAGDPVQRHRRRHPHRQRHRLRIVVGGVHQPPRLHHALRRPSCRSARSTSARSRAIGSS